MENTIEIWKDIPDYKGYYQVSSLGRVRSLSRIILRNGKYPFLSKERLLKQGENKGYLFVCLQKDSVSKLRNVHQLVSCCFLNHTPCGFKLVINHKNFNRKDNRLENLEIVTTRENTNKKHLQSTSKYVGVSWSKQAKKWVASIYKDGRLNNLGYFIDETEASKYYENALISIKDNNKIIVKKPIFSSKYKGVSWHKRDNKWICSIFVKGKNKHLGYFENEIEAHKAYQIELELIKNT